MNSVFKLIGKTLSRIIISLILIYLGFLVGRSVQPQLVNPPETVQKERPTQPKPYFTNVPVNYFDTKSVMDFNDEGIMISDDRFTVKTAPELTNVDPSTIETINRELPFPLSLLRGTLKGKSLGEGGWEDKKYDLNGDGDEREFNIRIVKETDVDGDGKKEMIVYASTNYQHGAGMGAIVNQLGKVTFLSEDLPNFSIFSSQDNNGFYTAEKLTTVGLYGVGGFRVTRYMHQDSKFIPVWTQDEFDPIVKK